MKHKLDADKSGMKEENLSILEQLINLLPNAVNIKNREHEWVQLNEAFATLSQYPREYLLGKTAFDVVTEADAERLWQQDDEVFQTKRDKCTIEKLVSLKGETRWIEVKKSYFQSETGSEYVITVLTDITELKKRESDLIAAQEKLVRAAKARSLFLANMGSDIRDPMTTISRMADSLKETALEANQLDILNKLERSGDRLFRIIDDIMDFSKMDAGLMKIARKPFDPNMLVENLASSLGVAARDKRLDLIFSIDPDLPEFVLGDAARIQQILMNIAENAIKYTSKGHVHLAVSGTDIGAETELEFTVRDTGPGIPENALKDIVDDYQDAAGASDRGNGVSGLGLSLCRKLANLMDGKIEISSKPGEGTEIKLLLTLARDPNSASVTNIRDLKPILPHSKILIVDDVRESHHALRSKLGLLGLTADYAASAKAAARKLALAYAEGEPYTLLFVDYLMPGVDGLLFVNSIAQNPNYKNVEIVVLSSVNDEEVKSCFTSDGLADYLCKPVRRKELEQAIMAVSLRETLRQKNPKGRKRRIAG